MRDKLLNTYALLFGRPAFLKLNRFLYHAAIKGMGVLNYKNDYLSGEDGFLKKFLKGKKNPVVFDVGANVGRYAQMILKYNNTTEIHCFEPHPSTFKKLENTFNSTQRKQVNLNNLGVGNQTSTLELYDYEATDGTSHASIYKDVIETLHAKKAIAVKIDVIDLNSYITSNQISQIDLLKIDTEGNELNVLKGLGDQLNNGTIQAIHFEFIEMNIISKSSFKEFWDILAEFELYRLLPRGKMIRINEYIALECEIYAFQNIIALKK